MKLRERRFFGLPVQLKYAVFLTLVAGFMALVMIFVMAWFIQRNYNLFMADELGVSAHVVEVAQREQRILEVTLFCIFVGSVTLMFLASFYVTRRLTLPLLTLQRSLWLYSRGDWTRVFRLRPNDEFKELERIVNDLRHQRLADQKAPHQEIG